MQNDTSPASNALGSWILTSYENVAADGTRRQPLGAAPLGAAQFDRNGRFMITVMRADIAPFASGNREQGTAEENAAVVRGSIAYFGTFEIAASGSDLELTILGATLPNWIGTKQTRSVVMPSPDILHLVNSTASSGGSAEIRWKRA